MTCQKTFEVIVIGGGHAGIEAAAASARMGVKTLLITHNINTIGQMSCNPSIGGIGKGHLVKEVDALGGVMARATDMAGIQFRILNSKKGPAVRATRAQADRNLYKQAVIKILENQPNLYIFAQNVTDLIIKNGTIKGIKTELGVEFLAKAVVLTAGTFLNGMIHIGNVSYVAGRAGDCSSIKLANHLREIFKVRRLKTGTPPRIDGKSIDFSKLKEQPGDKILPIFSFINNSSIHPRQIPCYITHTNAKTHDIIRANIKKSAMYSGKIECVGPRYCPSIEDKIIRFADKTSHQIFLEPEGLNSNEYYPNGISTSLPFDVQIDFVRSMTGLENAFLTQAAYAIEYDFFDPRDLKLSLETKTISGLFFAGQINGTTGYEEAAAQGLLAGLNAARFCHDKEAWTPARDEGYIGVMVDDLLTCGTNEPYRMFTSRAEYRLILREDNADARLTPKARELGLIDDTRWRIFNDKMDLMKNEIDRVNTTWIRPNTDEALAIEAITNQPILHEYKLADLLKRPELSYEDLIKINNLKPKVDNLKVLEQVEIQIKYEGYIKRQSDEIAKNKKFNELKIPAKFDYNTVSSLSNEVRQKLIDVQPTTIGQAARIPGVTPAAISLLLVYVKKSC